MVNLRSNAINGPIIGTTTPVSLADGFTGSVNYLFASAIAVVPNVTYFLQAVVQSGDNWGITALGDTYPAGVFYGGLTAFSGNDLWFREGIVVPEPTSAAGADEVRGLPSAPARPLVVTDAPDRPQPRRDVLAGNGMTVTVGRIREDNIFHLRFVASGHNTVRGAAGGSILNAELLAATGRLAWRPPARG